MGKHSLPKMMTYAFESLTTQSRFLTTLYKKPFKNIVGKEENAGNQHFLIFFFSHNVLYPFQNKFQFFSYIYYVVCKCFQLDQSKILLFGKELRVEGSDNFD